MTDIHTVPIHHVDLDTESWVPPENVEFWVTRGWTEGPLERLQAQRDAQAEKDAVRAKAAADAQAFENELTAARESGDTERVTQLLSDAAPTPASVEQAAPIAASRTSGRGEPAPSGEPTPSAPEED